MDTTAIDPTSALISAGGGIIEGFLGNIYQQAAEKRQWRRTLQMWNMTNEYNSPVQQMKRLKQAGLNPNLMYQNAMQGSSASMGQAPTSINQNPIGTALDRVTTLANIKLMQAQARKTNEEADLAAQRAKTEEKEQSLKAAQERNWDLKNQYDLATLDNRTAQVLQDLNTSRVQYDALQLQYKFQSESYDLRMMQLDIDVESARQKYSILSNEAKASIYLVAQAQQEIALKKAQTYGAYAQARLADANASLTNISAAIQRQYGFSEAEARNVQMWAGATVARQTADIEVKLKAQALVNASLDSRQREKNLYWTDSLNTSEVALRGAKTLEAGAGALKNMRQAIIPF